MLDFLAMVRGEAVGRAVADAMRMLLLPPRAGRYADYLLYLLY